MGKPAASPPAKGGGGPQGATSQVPAAGRGCQLPARALGADLKRQDPAPNSWSLAGTQQQQHPELG